MRDSTIEGLGICACISLFLICTSLSIRGCNNQLIMQTEIEWDAKKECVKMIMEKF